MATYDYSVSSLYLSRGAPEEQQLDGLLSAGVFNLEVALSSWFPESTYLKEKKLSSNILKRCGSITRVLQAKGIAVAGLHSVFFESTGLNVFARCTDTLDYLVSRIAYCDYLGGKFVVIGSPAVRNSGLAREICWDNYCWLLHGALERTKNTEVKILTEALPICPVFSSIFDLLELVKSFDCDRVGLHMDLNSMVVEDELTAVLEADLERVEHVHINDPSFNPLYPGQRQSELTVFSEILKRNSYDGLIGLEYVTPSGLTPESGQLSDSINFIKDCLNDRRHWR